ncbi:MAG: hypothetical protein LC772_01605, partial [Chloroflexi bacterium]|nr:hypothetical protein [Chloroflexota bacterium]
ARSSRQHRLALLLVSVGFLGDALLAAATLLPLPAAHTFLGPFDGLRWRLLRLAQIAALALPVLLLVYDGVEESGAGSGGIRRGGRWAMIFGAVGMPLTLAAAALLDYRLKYALAVPAYAIVAAAVIGTCSSWKNAGRLERSGWLLLTATFVAGLGMGIYAFNGPFPPPRILGDYSDIPRRLVRLAHTYVVVFGLFNILAGRLVRTWQGRRGGTVAAVLAAAEVITIIGLLTAAFFRAPGWLLVPGPLLLALCAAFLAYPPKLAIARTQPEE